jgi:hypothetical protein
MVQYLLHILTVVNVFSYAIVLFQVESLWTRNSGTRQRMPEVRGVMVTTTPSHDVPYIGGVNLRLFTGGAPIRDKLSSLVVPDPDLDPAPDCGLSSVKDSTKK